jgi:hypothetical protein
MGCVAVELELPDELWGELTRISQTLGLDPLRQSIPAAIADWVARRREELEDRDPESKYFVNQALDGLIAKK